MPTTSAPPLLTARQLRWTWPQGVLFEDLSFDLPAGLSLVTGDDGCGKSTLLRLLAGAWQPHAGTLRLAGSAALPGEAVWHQQVCWFDPDRPMEGDTDAHGTTCVGDFLHGLQRQYPTFSAAAISDLVDGLGLQPHLTKPLFMLSTGSRRKVWLAAAFAAGTPLTLIDQPFAALDGAAVRFVQELLREVALHSRRAWVIADHLAPDGVPLAATVTL